MPLVTTDLCVYPVGRAHTADDYSLRRRKEMWFMADAVTTGDVCFTAAMVGLL